MGQYQNNISELPGLEPYRYENIFKLYQTGDKDFYFYNILKKLQIPQDINNNLFHITTLPPGMPFTTLSYNLYGTTYLWWLICAINEIKNPFDQSLAGMRIKVLKKDYVKPVLDSIQQQLQ